MKRRSRIIHLWRRVLKMMTNIGSFLYEYIRGCSARWKTIAYKCHVRLPQFVCEWSRINWDFFSCGVSGREWRACAEKWIIIGMNDNKIAHNMRYIQTKWAQPYLAHQTKLRQPSSPSNTIYMYTPSRIIAGSQWIKEMTKWMRTIWQCHWIRMYMVPQKWQDS